MPSPLKNPLSICFIMNRSDDKESPLASVLKEYGHNVFVINLAKQNCEIRDGIISVDGETIEPENFNGIIKRLTTRKGAGDFEKSDEVIKIFEQHHIPAYSTSEASRNAADKIKTYDLFTKAGVNTPLSIVFNNAVPTSEKQITEALGSPPYVVKKAFGANGNGVTFCHSAQEAVEQVKQ